MKKIINILGIFTLIGTSATNLIACNKLKEYTPDELVELKEENKIKTNNEEIKNNLEWIAPQEKPFNNVDYKYYFIVWKKDKWKISKVFRNHIIEENKKYNIYKSSSNYELNLFKNIASANKIEDVSLIYGYKNPSVFIKWGEKNYEKYIKSVYRWNLYTQEPDLILDENDNLKVNV